MGGRPARKLAVRRCHRRAATEGAKVNRIGRLFRKGLMTRHASRLASGMAERVTCLPAPSTLPWPGWPGVDVRARAGVLPHRGESSRNSAMEQTHVATSGYAIFAIEVPDGRQTRLLMRGENDPFTFTTRESAALIAGTCGIAGAAVVGLSVVARWAVGRELT